MAGRPAIARPGRQWSRHFNHPYTARKTPPRPVIPVAGVNTGAPWALFNAAFGPVLGFRGYNTPTDGVPASWPGPSVTIPAGVPASGQIVSIKPDVPSVLSGSLDAALATFFATVPAGAFITAWHEAELAYDGASSDIVAMHARIYGIFLKNAPVAASYGQIVATGPALVGNANFPLSPWISAPGNGGVNLDFYGMDIYPATSTVTFDFEIQAAISTMTALGVPQTGPWSICEIGYRNLWVGSQGQWYSDGWATAQAIGALHYFGFFSPDVATAFILAPQPNPDVLRILQDIASVSRGDVRSPPAGAMARSTQGPMVSSSSSASLTTTFSSNPTAGSKVLAIVQSTQPANTTLAVTDNGATPSTFKLDACALNPSSSLPSVYIFRADGVTLPGAGTYAVTVTRSAAGPLQVAAIAYTGVQNGPPSATSGVTGASNNPAMKPVTPDDQSSLFISAFFCDSAASPESFVVASPEFTLQQKTTTGSGGAGPGGVADALVGSPATRQGGWTLPDSPNWAAVMAAYGALPLKMQIVPGANMTWAQAPDADTAISVNAGVASASGAALKIFPGVNAGLAAASGWAAVNSPAASTTATAGLAPASGSALNPAVNVAPAAGLAPGTGAGLGPSVTVTVTTGLAAGSGAGKSPAAGVSPTAGLASGSGAGNSATALTGVSPTAGLAAASGAAPAPAVSLSVTAGLAPASAAGKTPVAQVSGTPGAAAASGAAFTPSVTASGAASAGLAASTAAAQTPAPNVLAGAGLPAAAGYAAVNMLGTVVTAGLAGGSAAALFDTAGSTISLTMTGINPVGSVAAALAPAATVAVTAGLAAATGTAFGATASGSGSAPAGLAAASAAAKQPTLSISETPAAGLAAAGAAALNPAAAITGAPAGPAASGAALAAGVAVAPTAGLAAGAAAGLAATAVTGVAPTAGAATATATARTPAAGVAPAASVAAGTAAGVAAVMAAGPAAGVGAASGSGLAAVPADGAQAAAAAAAGAGRTPSAAVFPVAGVAAGTATALAATTPSGTVAQTAQASAAGGQPAATVTVTAGLAGSGGAAAAATGLVSGTPAQAAAIAAAQAVTSTGTTNPAAALAVSAGAARAPAATVLATAGLAGGSGAGRAPALTLTTLAAAAAAQALAQALAAAGQVVIPAVYATSVTTGAALVGSATTGGALASSATTGTGLVGSTTKGLP